MAGTTPAADNAIWCLLCDLIAVTDRDTSLEEWQAATQRLRSARRDGWAVFAAALAGASSLPPLDPSDPNADYPPRKRLEDDDAYLARIDARTNRMYRG